MVAGKMAFSEVSRAKRSRRKTGLTLMVGCLNDNREVHLGVKE